MKSKFRFIRSALVLAVGLMFSAPVSSFAQDAEPFTPAHWGRGLRLFAGIGANSSVFRSDEREERIGIGVNLQTDLSYFLSNDLAVELSANVMFNRVRNLLIWDSLFTLGVRTRFPYLSYDDNVAPYVRAFIGGGPSVIYFEDDPIPPPYDELGAHRLHLEGIVAGFGVGQLHRARNGQIWFLELIATAHAHTRMAAVTSKDDVPIVVSSSAVSDHATLYALALTMGVMAF